MASPKEPRYDVLSRTRNAPGSWSCSSWMAVGHSGAQPGAGGSPPQAQGCPQAPILTSVPAHGGLEPELGGVHHELQGGLLGPEGTCRGVSRAGDPNLCEELPGDRSLLLTRRALLLFPRESQLNPRVWRAASADLPGAQRSHCLPLNEGPHRPRYL